MKVTIEREGLLKAVADKGLGVADIARAAGMSQDTISKIFYGYPVLLKTATKLYSTLKDERVKILCAAQAST